ncbi:thioredoxin fold domain-containing protein, partial [Candidatus Saccharibacteria bacterium]|nr:thioredoxin fold domain-containing protein [Candidatus Saccharibacteria bacterium]NIV03780.1 thioredoxin fold domain-containing protein [Calditrichia bacterium]NIW79213.1 thioredoxin fold domain-containing protein [Calditrichia bacterium]
GFLMFFTLAMGLGVPFIFLAMFSGAINYIPRSGAWMVWVKKIFGFILIGMAFYFLEPLFDNVLWYYTLLGITALIAGIYLALIDSAQGTGKAFPVVKNLVGVVFVLLSAFFWVNSVEAYVDERLYQLRQSAGGNSAFAANQIDWQSYSQKTIQTAKANNKPVMIDFYADWCIPCKELDQFTFSDSRVIELSKNFTMIKADLTKSQSPEVKALQKKYEIKGVPTLVFLNRKGKEIEETRVVNYIKADQFLSIMKNVLKKGGGENQSQADIVRK